MWVCTVRPDGRPHLTPIWFVFHDDAFWIATGRENIKTRNVLDRPQVALSLEEGNDPVVAEGTVTLHDAPFRPDVIEAFMAKFGWDISKGEDADVGTIIVWEITVDRWLMGGPA